MIDRWSVNKRTVQGPKSKSANYGLELRNDVVGVIIKRSGGEYKGYQTDFGISS